MTQMQDTSGLDGLRVLIVDDNAALRGLLRVSLQAFGCQSVCEAASVDKALEILTAGGINLLITDWKMQPRDGLDLVRTVRNPSTSPVPYLPIVMLTGYSDGDRIETARNAGVNDFLIKPFTVPALAQCLERIVTDDRAFIQTDDFFGPDRRCEPRPDTAPAQRETASK